MHTQTGALDIVRDDAGVLSSEEDRKLTALLQEVLDQTGVKVLIVLVPTTAPDNSERYGGRLMEYWARRGHGLPALQRELARKFSQFHG